MTSKKILLLGNSHTAAPRIALRDDPDRWPGLRSDVLAMPGDSLRFLVLRGDALVSQGDEASRKMHYYNGVTEQPLSGYDAFVVIGGLSFHQLAHVQATHRSPDFPSVKAGEPCHLISAGFADAILGHFVCSAPAMQLIAQLQRYRSAPIIFMDTVFPSAECGAQRDIYGVYQDMFDRGDAPYHHARYLRACGDALGDEVIHIEQPRETVVDQVFTAPEWMRGSFRMQPRRDVRHDATDYSHPNPLYGQVQLDLIVAALARL